MMIITPEQIATYISEMNPEMKWVHTGIVLLLGSLLFYVLRAVTRRPLLHGLGWTTMLLSAICLIVSMVLRSQAAGYFALSNMYESMLMMTIWIQLAYLVMDRWFRLPNFGWPVALLTFTSLSYAITLPTTVNPLQAALQSYWRSIHVPVIILSYAMFTLAFLSSLVYLGKDFFESRSGKHHGGKLATAGAGNSTPDLAQLMTTRMEAASDSSSGGALTSEHSDLYDEITYRCVSLGFPLLAIGIILGGMWANEAWGNYWSWDPKESMSLVTLLGYGIYLHMRVNGEHHPRVLAWVSVIGFVLMLVTYFGVNLMGLGLHSYGKIG